MLASDSDSEFEYPADTNDSDASDDCALLGKLALGLDPQDMRTYDGWRWQVTKLPYAHRQRAHYGIPSMPVTVVPLFTIPMAAR